MSSGNLKYYRSTISGRVYASPIEPETLRALKIYGSLPSVEKQFEIDDWVKDIKTAAGLPHWVDNLHTVFDVVYLLGVNTRNNARIDFVTGVRKAEEINISEGDFIPWQGYYASSSQGRAVDMKWDITSENNKGAPEDNHFHVSQLSYYDNSGTTNMAGIPGYSLVPLQSVSTILYFRFRWGSSNINNVNNNNTRGSYTVGRSGPTTVFAQINEDELNTWTRSLSGYNPGNALILSGVESDGSPNAPRFGMLIGSMTAGSSSVNLNLLARADKNYFEKQGITLY